MSEELKILLSAGFLPRQGSKAQGIGWQEEKAACLRTFDTGGVLLLRKTNARKIKDSEPLGCRKPPSA